MSADKVSNHYVPRLILRKFSDKLAVYNVKNSELKENIAPEHAYQEMGLYDNETEKNLNIKVESQFGNLLSNVLLKGKDTIQLNRDQLLKVKKFLLISLLRTKQNEDFLQKEKLIKDLKDPEFKEKEIEGETPYEYWMRTLNSALDSDGTPRSVFEQPNKTYGAYRWANIINDGYIAFWDAPDVSDEFVITDIGMTSENEKGWDGITSHNIKKYNFLIELINRSTDEAEKTFLSNFIQTDFSENFMMFPISAKRMIVLICPFYKCRYALMQAGLDVIPLSELTAIPNENLFKPNTNFYVKTNSYVNTREFDKEDKYIYDIKKLSRDEIRYCNALFMDRIDTFLGFSSLENAVGGIVKYKKLNDPPYVPRVDYSNLYKIIEKRYLGSL